ncbi:MAG: biotin--[acetyl-CoA-carboxylase] ligase [Leptospirales bacterium]|nr:biotin--[acetyl-CoA-carboxylase] ligase [Leptospirales bacterium]
MSWIDCRPETWLRLDEVDSTNDYLRRSKTNAGVVVLARMQTRGRGRRGRSWQSRPGDSLILSVALDLPPRFSLPLLPLMAGVALYRSLQQLPGAQLRRLAIKWPNDLYLHHEGQWGKLAGLLAEAEGGQDLQRVILGLGLNWQGQAPILADNERPETPAFSLFPDGAPLPLDECVAGFARQLNEILGGSLTGEEVWLSELRQANYLDSHTIQTEQGPAMVCGIGDDGALLAERLSDGRLLKLFDWPEQTAASMV